MADSMYGVPVIPGPGGARRPRPGEPGHLERLIDARAASWPLEQRAHDLQIGTATYGRRPRGE